MSKFTQKVVSAALALATVVSLSGNVAHGQTMTAAEIQAMIATLTAQLATLQAQLTAATGTPSAAYNFTRDLTVGSEGADVTALQNFLIAQNKGAAARALGNVGATGYFGTYTRNAVAEYQAARNISPTLGYFGPITRADVNALSVYVPPITPGTPVGGPLTVALTSDNPPAANVQKGSANNQVLKFVLTSGSTPVSVTGITLQSYGTIRATGALDLSAVKLFDENGVQIGNDRTPTGNQVIFTIVPALTIPANSSRTLTAAVNVDAANADTLATVRYGLASASAITGGTFSGNYPLIGNSFTIVPAGQLGTLSVGDYDTLPKTGIKTGEKDVVLERFNVSAGSNEDIAVNQVILTRTKGTDTNFSNLRLRKVGESSVIGGPVSFSNKKATFNLTSPISLIKGASVNLEVIGDLSDAVGTPFAANVAAGGVVGRGLTSGTNVTSTGNTAAEDIGLSDEALSVSMSASHPQGSAGAIVKSANRVDLAKFDVRATGGNVILNTITMKFAKAGNELDANDYLSSVGLYEGDSLVSDLINVDDEKADGQVFTLNWTIPASTTKTLTVKGVTNKIATVGNITTTFQAYTGFGLASGNAVNKAALALAATPVTMNASGTAVAAADTVLTPYTQGILYPSVNVTLGALKITVQNEDMKLSDLVLTSSHASKVGQVTLFASDGIPLSNAVAENTGTFTFSTAEYLNDIIFTKGVPKTILIKGNPIAAQNAFKFTIADADDQLSFTGALSGADYDMKDAWDGAFDFEIASPYAGGKFDLDAEVVTISKDSASPSGSVSRGSFQTYATWNVVNNSATGQTLNLSRIKFTSKSGLPSGLDNAADEVLFRVVDENGTVVFTGDATRDTLTKASGTIEFNTTGGNFDATKFFSIPYGTPKKMSLQIITTDTAKWPSNTQMQWSIEAVGDVVVEDNTINETAVGDVGYASGIWSIPAVANIVTLP